MSEQEIITKLVAFGHIDEAISEANKAGLYELALKIETSVADLKNFLCRNKNLRYIVLHPSGFDFTLDEFLHLFLLTTDGTDYIPFFFDIAHGNVIGGMNR